MLSERELFVKNKRLVTGGKYFWEHPKNPHLDYRYCRSIDISKSELKTTLVDLLSFLMEKSKDSSIDIFLMHGGLIGHYFGGQMLPWDDDLDVCLMFEDMEKLKGSTINNSKYLLEINKNYAIRDIDDKENRIDARLISKRNGMFIDITAYLKCLGKNSHKIICKDGNEFLFDDIFPLNKSTFEGVEIYVPKNVKNVLVAKYGEKVLNPEAESGPWRFDKVTNKWHINYFAGFYAKVKEKLVNTLSKTL